jgi:hypothetical protein
LRTNGWKGRVQDTNGMLERKGKEHGEEEEKERERERERERNTTEQPLVKKWKD